MKIAVISDIHSNIYGLEAVINDAKAKDVDQIVCLGDMVGYYTFPNEVINLIRKERIPTIMGNYDDAVGYERMVCGCDYPDPRDAENALISLNWTIDNTSDENKKFLRELPLEMILKFEGKAIRFVHGSTRAINEYLKENSKESEEVMGTLTEDILVCAHTHKPYCKMYGNKILINSGSAGKPKTGRPDANYVIINISSEKVTVDVAEVPYDYEKTAKAAEKMNVPKEFVEILRTGRA